VLWRNLQGLSEIYAPGGGCRVSCSGVFGLVAVLRWWIWIVLSYSLAKTPFIAAKVPEVSAMTCHDCDKDEVVIVGLNVRFEFWRKKEEMFEVGWCFR
jgi:hypothetical protein